MENKSNYQAFEELVSDISKAKTSGKLIDDLDTNTLYLGHIAMYMAKIADDIHEINRKMKVQK